MTECYVCGKKNISKNEIGLTKKLFGKETKRFYCISCMAEELQVTPEELLDKIEEFKDEGCTMFD
jgi:predicted nucleic-acid-binding Zn-ribbon protein